MAKIMDVSKATFKVFYDGEALASGAMNVRDLAPALLAFGDLLENTNRVVNGPETQVTVKIKTFPEGCFGINFEVLHSLRQQFVHLFSGPDITAAANLLTLLGLNTSAVTVKGLVWLIKEAKGRWPKKSKVLENGNISLEFEGGDTLEAPEKVVALYRDVPTREAFDKAISPLDVDGIDSFSTVLDGDIREKIITKVERPFFVPPHVPDTKLFDDAESIRMLSIQSLNFKEGNKWLVSDGSNQFWVVISDKEFIHAVENNEPFSKGDLLKVKLITRQWKTGSGELKTEYEVTKVIEHTIARSLRQQLPIDG